MLLVRKKMDAYYQLGIGLSPQFRFSSTTGKYILLDALYVSICSSWNTILPFVYPPKNLKDVLLFIGFCCVFFCLSTIWNDDKERWKMESKASSFLLTKERNSLAWLKNADHRVERRKEKIKTKNSKKWEMCWFFSYFLWWHEIYWRCKFISTMCVEFKKLFERIKIRF